MAERVHGIHTPEEWQAKLKEAETANKLIIVDFTATWCGPCRVMSPVFQELSKTYTDALFLKVDVDEMPTITSEWKVEAMPTFLFIKGGKAVDKIVGADKEQLKKKVAQHCAPAQPAPAAVAQA